MSGVPYDHLWETYLKNWKYSRYVIWLNHFCLFFAPLRDNNHAFDSIIGPVPLYWFWKNVLIVLCQLDGFLLSGIYPCPYQNHLNGLKYLDSIELGFFRSRKQIVLTHFKPTLHKVTQSCLTLCDPMDSSMPGLPVHHQPLEFTEIYVHWVSDEIQLSHPLLSPSPPAFYLSQHQGLF